jgi:glycosyltransferase involved in cell wall biosynthesis
LTGHWEEDIRDLFALMDVFVLLAPGSEGTGRALLEAMAMGLPSVVANSGGLAEIILEGGSGLVVPPGEPLPLARALIGLLREPERAGQMGAAARKRVEENYALSLLAERTEGWYLERLGGR